MALVVVGPGASAPLEGPTRAPAGGGQATLQVIVTGQNGRVSVSAGEDCDVSKFVDQGTTDGCLYEISQGQSVTLAPVSGTLVGWSVFECPETGSCAVTMDSDRTVVATFAPTSLTVVVEGGFLLDAEGNPLVDADLNPIEGTVRTSDGKIVCSGSNSARTGAMAPSPRLR